MSGNLTKEQIECFVANGYVRIPSLFSADAAYQCRETVWNDLSMKCQILKGDQSTWVKKQQLDICYPVNPEGNDVWSFIPSEKLNQIADELCGLNTVDMSRFGFGWWSLSFPGFCEPPNDMDGHWHIEGHNFQHFCDSMQLGCFLIMLFNDVPPEGAGGATLIMPGSHLIALEHVIESGMRGMSSNELALILMEDFYRLNPFIEACGNAGDVYFCHRLLLHGRGKHLGLTSVENVRFMCHPSIPLKSSLNLQLPCPLQECIIRVLDKRGWDVVDVSVNESRIKFNLNNNEEEEEEEDTSRKRKIEDMDSMNDFLGFNSFK